MLTFAFVIQMGTEITFLIFSFSYAKITFYINNGRTWREFQHGGGGFLCFCKLARKAAPAYYEKKFNTQLIHFGVKNQVTLGVKYIGRITVK